MKIIKTNTILKDFKGGDLKQGENSLTIGEVLSTILAGKSSNPSLAWQLGKKFATEEKVELKAEDIVFLKKEIEANDAWFSIVKGQVLELLESSDK